ncbi:hypothetical protein NDU88_000832 [Pleurodeles waltl]|uniref:Uncharacterized protein n=1 Tax=Pleurodeles waltl TaxID=8319 RepID=A0AAV7V638_PLEWA|nr:hypothetical protein NDU88_000832 [Pleurodeles waltl]
MNPARAQVRSANLHRGYSAPNEMFIKLQARFLIINLPVSPESRAGRASRRSRSRNYIRETQAAVKAAL